MKTKHTKGEWIACKITNTTNYSVRTKEKPELIIIPTNLTDINETIHNDLIGEAIANAKLISAAPDLLEACIESLAALKAGYIEQRAGATKMILDAIRKATE